MKTRNGLFADVPENLWNDWHWQVANRAETVEDLKKYMNVKESIARIRRIGEDKVACVKRGVVMPEDHCGAFKYDALKRVPPRPMKLDTDKLREEDFQL